MVIRLGNPLSPCRDEGLLKVSHESLTDRATAEQSRLRGSTASSLASTRSWTVFHHVAQLGRSRSQPDPQQPVSPGRALVDFHGEGPVHRAVGYVGAHYQGVAAGSDCGGSTCRTGGRRRGASRLPGGVRRRSRSRRFTVRSRRCRPGGPLRSWSLWGTVVPPSSWLRGPRIEGLQPLKRRVA